MCSPERIESYIQKLDVQHSDMPKELSGRRTIVHVLATSVLFLSWGLVYGLVDRANYHVCPVLDIMWEEGALMAADYYSTDFPARCPSRDP